MLPSAPMKKKKTRTDTVQLCRRCQLEKPVDAFHKDKRTPTGHYDICRSCRSIHRNITAISKEYYQELLSAQNYSCAICGISAEESNQGLVVDHNHQTHLVRGLLCMRCNVGLGYFKDDTTRLSMAIEYLVSKDGID